MSNSNDEFESDMDDDSMVEESPISLANLENINDIETLEKLTSEKINTIFDPDCVRKRSNWSKSSNIYKFDTEQFNPKILLEDIPSHSPKLDALLSKIEKLDANDMQQHGKLFKHFIFSDLKSGSFGSKLVAGALIAKGFTLGYTAKNKNIPSSQFKSVNIPPAPPTTPIESLPPPESFPPVPPNSIESFTPNSVESLPPNSMASFPPAPPNSMASLPPAPPNSMASLPPVPQNSVESFPNSVKSLSALEESFAEDTVNESSGGAKSNTYGKIELLTDAELAKTPNKNFYLLCSISVYEQNITVKQKKAILQKMNQRPENINGELARIIVMDSGFKEGIDLFDIKYVHIFEPQVTTADQKQVIGRATRTCGQKGLDFHPMRGWPLHVFIYDIDIPQNLREYMLHAPSAFNLYLKALHLDVRLIEFTHDLERLSIYGSVDYELNKNIHEFTVSGNSSEVGGAAKSNSRRLIVRNDLPILHLPRELSQLSFNQDTNIRPTFQQMREYINTHFSQFTWEKAKMENLCGKGGASHALRYTPTQDFIRHYFTPTAPVKGMLLHHSVGTGKCHAKDTPILLHNGLIKKVQDIEVGDILMGDDSGPRKVLSLANGQDEMFKIVPVKGDSYTVNSEHILCLKFSGKGSISYIKEQKNQPYRASYFDNKKCKIVCKSFAKKEDAEYLLSLFKQEDKIVEIEVNKYLKLSKSLQKELKGYRKGVEFPHKEVDIEPYMIGLWLGDGGSRDPIITNQDAAVLKYLNDILPKYDLHLNYQSGYTYRFTSYSGKPGANAFWNAMKKYNLYENKHIPYDYKCNSREYRMKLLAGIIDSDGYYCSRGKMYSIAQKSNVLTEDILYLVRSLGFAAYSTKTEKSCMYKNEKRTGIYNTISISGNGLEEIPTIIKRKQAEKRNQKKDALITGITVEPVGKGDYYGFTLDGNNRYLIGDFTVTHNTCSAIAAATTTFEKQGYTILWVTRTTLKNDIWKNMFDQVCNEQIREELEKGLIMPAEQNKRMRLLSQSWSIRPMSYKQFSNLVSKQNNFYKALVKKNGEADPLRKTLLIIDEAHKLYGGGDLSTIERPDMNALKRSIEHSYQLSGIDSVRLLLMTATPITENPMELIKLLNLCKPSQDQMPELFDDFSKEYLDDYGRFTRAGEANYLDKIAGHISFLNREKDARQFSQPIVKFVTPSLITDLSMAKRYDKKYVRQYLNSDVNKLKADIVEKTDTIDKELQDLDANRFEALHDVCNSYEGKMQKECKKVVRANIRDLLKEAKAEVQQVRDSIKSIREEIKNKNLFKTESLAKIKENLENNPEEYKRFKDTMYYQLKEKCGKVVKTADDLKEAIKEHPIIIELNEQLREQDIKIEELKEKLKNDLILYKKRIQQIKEIMKMELTQLEKNVLRIVLRDERKTQRKNNRLAEKEMTDRMNEFNKTKRNIEKKKRKKTGKIRKTLREVLNEEKAMERETKRAEKKLKKTLRKEGKLRENIENEMLQELFTKYSKIINDELIDLKEIIENDNAAKLEKENAKNAAKLEKENVKKATKLEKENAKVERQKEKVRLANEKAYLREREKLAKKMAKETKKAERLASKKSRKTKKISQS